MTSAADAIHCCDKCKRAPRCAHFNFEGGGTCMLLSTSTTREVADADAVAGTVGSGRWEWSDGVDLATSEYSALDVDAAPRRRRGVRRDRHCRLLEPSAMRHLEAVPLRAPSAMRGCPGRRRRRPPPPPPPPPPKPPPRPPPPDPAVAAGHAAGRAVAAAHAAAAARAGRAAGAAAVALAAAAAAVAAPAADAAAGTRRDNGERSPPPPPPPPAALELPCASSRLGDATVTKCEEWCHGEAREIDDVLVVRVPQLRHVCAGEDRCGGAMAVLPAPREAAAGSSEAMQLAALPRCIFRVRPRRIGGVGGALVARLGRRRDAAAAARAARCGACRALARRSVHIRGQPPARRPRRRLSAPRSASNAPSSTPSKLDDTLPSSSSIPAATRLRRRRTPRHPPPRSRCRRRRRRRQQTAGVVTARRRARRASHQRLGGHHAHPR